MKITHSTITPASEGCFSSPARRAGYVKRQVPPMAGVTDVAALRAARAASQVL